MKNKLLIFVVAGILLFGGFFVLYGNELNGGIFNIHYY